MYLGNVVIIFGREGGALVAFNSYNRKKITLFRNEDL